MKTIFVTQIIVFFNYLGMGQNEKPAGPQIGMSFLRQPMT